MNRRTTPAELEAAFLEVARVCRHFKVRLDEIESHDRHWRICWPRFCAYWLVRRATGWGWTKLGYFFGRHKYTIRRGYFEAVSLMNQDRSKEGRALVALAKGRES